MATTFDLRLTNERRGDTPNHVKVTCRHVMFTADEKCQPLRNSLYVNRAINLSSQDRCLKLYFHICNLTINTACFHTLKLIKLPLPLFSNPYDHHNSNANHIVPGQMTLTRTKLSHGERGDVSDPFPSITVITGSDYDTPAEPLIEQLGWKTVWELIQNDTSQIPLNPME